jgi:Spy/CpxP family protein refolding chaperone
MFLKAADDLTLADDKKASLTKIEDSLKPNPDDKNDKSEMKALHTELLTQVKAGKIDQSKLDPHLAAIEKDVQARQDKEAAALDDLHKLLDAGQRKTVVADVRAKSEAREAKMAKMAASKEDFAKKRLAHMTDQLTLDDAQQKKVQAIMDKDDTKPADLHAEMKKQMDALLTAFEGDTFDAKKQDVFTSGAKRARAMAGKETAFLSQVIPLLKPEQRDKLVTTLEKRSQHLTERPGQGMPPLFMEEMDDEKHGDQH